MVIHRLALDALAWGDLGDALLENLGSQRPSNRMGLPQIC